MPGQPGHGPRRAQPVAAVRARHARAGPV